MVDGEEDPLGWTYMRAKATGPQQQQAQWDQQETKEFIAVRGELERDFRVAKRNKTLWEIVSEKMRERGYSRTPEQCKCKWKNLINRYKRKEEQEQKEHQLIDDLDTREGFSRKFSLDNVVDCTFCR